MSKLQERTKKLAIAARELKSKGLTNRAIAEEMNAAGLKNNRGAAVTSGSVAHYLKGKLRKRRESAKAETRLTRETAVERNPKEDTLEIIEIILASKLSSERKIKTVQQLLS